MKESQDTSELMSVATVAKRIKHSPATVYGLIESGRLAHYRCPGIRVSEEQLQTYLESVKQPAQKTEPSSPPARVKLRHISV